MINAFLMTILSHAVQSIIGSGVFQEIERLVMIELGSTGKTGAEKQAAVQASLKAAQGDLGVAVRSTAGWALNLGIETAVAQVNTKMGQSVTVTPSV
jgi:hypothetical protein